MLVRRTGITVQTGSLVEFSSELARGITVGVIHTGITECIAPDSMDAADMQDMGSLAAGMKGTLLLRSPVVEAVSAVAQDSMVEVVSTAAATADKDHKSVKETAGSQAAGRS